MIINKEFKNSLNVLEKNSINISLLEFKEKIIEIKRVTKVVTGGKNLSFRVITILGDLNGKIGYGVARGNDVATAVNKSILYAKKNLILVPLTINYSIPYYNILSYKSCKIQVIPTKHNTGIIANNVISTICELAGLKNIIVKQFGSNNILNNVKLIFKIFLKLNEQIEKNKYRNIFYNNNFIKNYFLY